MKQMKILGVLAIAATLGLTACGGGGGKKSSSKHTHKWGEYVTVKAATCTENGSQERECSECHEKQTKTIPAAHTWGQWEEVTPASCSAEGQEKRICSVCQAEETQPIAKLAHTWSVDAEGKEIIAWDTEPSCTAAGVGGHRTCSVCGETEAVSDAEAAALGHKYVQDAEGNDVVTWTTEPTCKAGGKGTRHCERCGQDIEYTVDALGHDLKPVGGEQQAPAGEATVRVWHCERCGEEYLGFKANEVSEDSKDHLVFEPAEPAEGEEQGARFWGRPIGNSIPLTEDGSYVENTNYNCVYCSTETGDFFEYVFTLNATQAEKLQNCRLYCDAQPAQYLAGQDFWACDPSADEYTSGFFIDGADEHVEHNDDGTVVMTEDHERVPKTSPSTAGAVKTGEDGNPVMVKKGKRIEDYRYILYVDGQVKAFDPEIKAPVQGTQRNEKRMEYVMPYTFNLHEGKNTISLRMAAGYRSLFYNFIFRPYEEPETPPEPVAQWVEDTTTVMPTPAADAATVKRFVKEGTDDVKYEIDVKTANMTCDDESAGWKNKPSTGVFKLNNGYTASFNFALPKAFQGKMYQSCYMDSYNSNKTKKMFYQTNNHSNIEVKINGNAIDFSQFSAVTFQEVFGDETNGSNSLTKEVELGDVVLQGANVITYKRVETLNTLVDKFVFIGKDHDHAYVAGEKAADSALRVAECECGDSGYELQAADLTEGQKAPVASDKNTRLGKNIFDDVWNITGIKAGTYDLYLNAQNSSGNDNAYWNAATAIANGDRASNNGSTPELQAEYRYKVKIDNGEYTPIANDTERYSDFGLSNAKAAWTTKPVARLVIAEGAASLTIHNMNNGYSIWIYAARLMPVAA